MVKQCFDVGRTTFLKLGTLLFAWAVVVGSAAGAGAQDATPDETERLQEVALLGEQRFRSPAMLQAVRLGSSVIVGLDVDGYVTKWDRKTGCRQARWLIRLGHVRCMSLGNNEDILLIGSDTGLWEVRLGSGRAWKCLSEPVNHVQIEGRQIVVWTLRGKVYVDACGTLRQLDGVPLPIAAVGFVDEQPAVVSESGELWTHGSTGWKLLEKLPPATDYALANGYAICVQGRRIGIVEISTGEMNEMTADAPVGILTTTSSRLLLAWHAGMQQREVASLQLTAPPCLQKVSLPHHCLPAKNGVDVSAPNAAPRAVVAVGATVATAGHRGWITPKGHRDAVRYVRFTEDGSRVLSADAHELIMWNWRTRKLLCRRPLARCPRVPIVAYSPPHDLIAYARGTDRIVIDRVGGNEFRECLSFALPAGTSVSAVAWLRHDQPMLVIACAAQNEYRAMILLVEIHSETPRTNYTVLAQQVWPKGRIVRVCSASSESFMTLDACGNVRLWRYDSGRLVYSAPDERVATGSEILPTSRCYLVVSEASAAFDTRALWYETVAAGHTHDKPESVLVAFGPGTPASGYRAQLLAARRLPGGVLATAAVAGPVLLLHRLDQQSNPEWSSDEGIVTAAAIGGQGRYIAAGLSSGLVVVLTDR